MQEKTPRQHEKCTKRAQPAESKRHNLLMHVIIVVMIVCPFASMQVNTDKYTLIFSQSNPSRKGCPNHSDPRVLEEPVEAKKKKAARSLCQ
jgi:hypothetical protein